ncbi:MAG: response regulator [Planctomycetota bacterium]|nr:response regulator [Planctomycetota bacterium]
MKIENNKLLLFLGGGALVGILLLLSRSATLNLVADVVFIALIILLWLKLRRAAGLLGSERTQLDHLVKIRTAQLEEQAARAQAVNEAKSTFLAQMSHEIRTPMNVIIGISELALREANNPALSEYIGSIKQAGSNLLAIINDILDFSKIEAGKMEIVPVDYQFSVLLNDVINIVRMRIAEKSLRFVIRVDSALPATMTGDMTRLRQILLNLLSNAAKYTHHGHILLGAEGKMRADGQFLLAVTVADTGVGIKPEDMNKLFQDFSKLDYNIDGSGLGLSIAQNLTRLMGGTLTVESVFGQGSTFTLTVPQTIKDHSPLATVENPAVKSVLLYERRRVYVEPMVYMLSKLGVESTAAVTMADFLHALRWKPPAFVFVPTALFEEVRPELANYPNVTPVLLANFGEPPADAKIPSLVIPAHLVAIANILNGREEKHRHNFSDAGVTRFTAPAARVLIVDDISSNIIVASGLMAPYKMQIDTCMSGGDAVRKVEETPYDLVFMDHMMPGVDGIEATKRIRALGGVWENLPIIALTADAVSGMREMFLSNGMSDFLSKPIEMEKLHVILSKWIKPEKQLQSEVPPEKNAAARGDSSRSGERRDDGGVIMLSERRLPAVKGIDAVLGLARVGGEREAYLLALDFYRQDTRPSVEALKLHHRAGDYKNFTLQMHALQSAAASIGAPVLSERAAALENAGREGKKEFIAAHLGIFMTEMDAVLTELDAFFEGQS